MSATLLAVDVGNTNVTLGVYAYGKGGAELAHHWRMATHREQTSDEVLVTLRGLFDGAGFDGAGATDVILASVVPPLLPIWERVCRKLRGQPPVVVGPGIRTGMPVRYENPREVGADRIVNAVAAYALVGGPAIAVDFGTATTFDCVSQRGEYLGGAIFPGIHVSMEALFERASMLHRVEVARPRSVIGRTTTASLQSGLLYGYAGMVDAMVTRIRRELGAAAQVIATGGLAARIAAETETVQRVEPFLTLEGLRILFEKNCAPQEASA
ncbi:MAG: type III pantothenate kinase [Deltaproteobacteria bacterium]|nr:type III pantothenate kinase [Deltaproteobacteria bacterium]MDD9852598.1 type III pantothenate kinase [Deltaproteobacteria bacterium]MDD9873407.1 type III pantothenate kinase [Deltaproteobacteria bacterium]